MAVAAIKKYGGYALGGLAVALWLVALFLLAKTAQNSEQFGRLHPWILLINAAGVVVLLVLLAAKVRSWCATTAGHVIGSRLKARMVSIFGVLAIAADPDRLLLRHPVPQPRHRQLVQRRDRSRASNEALLLSRSVLDLTRREHLAAPRPWRDELISTQRSAPDRRSTSTSAGQIGALELTCCGSSGPHRSP